MFGQKNNKDKLDNIIYTEKDTDIYFIVDKYWENDLIYKFKNFLNNNISKDLKITIIYAFNKIIPSKDLGKNIGKTYKKYGIKLKNYVKEDNAKIITIGRSIYLATNGNTDIQIDCFLDDVFNDTYFYSPYFKSYIYPMFDFTSFIGKDCFDRNYSINQIKKCYLSSFNAVKIPELKFIKVENPNEFLKSYIGKNIDVGIDTETSSLDWFNNTVGCISLSFDGLTGYYLKFQDINKEVFEEFLKGKNLIWNNGKFDIKSLCNSKNNINRESLSIFWDNWLSGHVLNEMRSNSLKSQAFYYTYFGGYDDELDDYKKKYKNVNYLMIDEDILYKYACMDAIITYQCYFKMKRRIINISNNKEIYDGEIVKINLIDLLQKYIFPEMNVGIDIELQGINLSLQRLKEIGDLLEIDIENVKKTIREELNISKKVNLNSDEQVAKYLEELGWECHGKTKKDFFNVNNTTLNKWLKEGHAESQYLLLLREYEQLLKTFIGNEYKENGFWQYVKDNGKVHPHLYMFLTNTLRNRCANPNLQNLKAKGLYAQEFRSCFIPPSEDYGILEADYSGFQLRIMSILSKCPFMKDVFINKGGDLHSMTAYNVFCRNKTIGDLEKNSDKTLIDFEYFIKNKKREPYSLLRYKAKGCNFSLIFNTTGYNFAIETLESEWSLEDVENYIKENNLEKHLAHFTKSFSDRKFDLKRLDNPNFDKYWAVGEDIKKKFFETYPEVNDFIQSEINYARKNGFVRSVVGFMRKTPYLKYQGKDDDRKNIKNYENICSNSPVQTFEVFAVNLAIYRIYNYLKENNLLSKIFITVHDSIDLIYHKSEKFIVKEILEIMEKPLDIYDSVPIEVEAEFCEPLNSENPNFWGFGYGLYKNKNGDFCYRDKNEEEFLF